MLHVNKNKKKLTTQKKTNKKIRKKESKNKTQTKTEQQQLSVGADVRGSFLDVNLSQRDHVGMSHVTTNCAQDVLPASCGQQRMDTRRTTKTDGLHGPQ